MGCKATTKKGNPCKAPPLKGTDRCLAHSDAETRGSVRFTPDAGKLGGRKPKPRLIDVLRAEVEERMDEITAPFWEGLKSDNPKVAMESARELLDRTYGRPTQAVEVSGPEGEPVTAGVVLDADTAKAARDVLRRASADSGD